MNRSIPLSFLLIAVTAGATYAQDLSGINTSRQFRLERLADNHTRFTGEVQIEGGTNDSEWQFYADQVDIFSDESRLVATGNVVFTSDGARIAADRVEFGIDGLTGTFFNATGSTQIVEDVERSMFGTQEPEMQFWGEVIEKTGSRTYGLTRGGFTSCVQPTPRWEVKASSITLNLDEYAVLRNSVLAVKGVPLFYLPVMYFPIKADQDAGRTTGILIPTYGSSTIRGQSISNAFFWAVNRSHDATFFHDWFPSMGQGFGAEYNYVLGAGAQGTAQTYLLNEREMTLVDRFAPGGSETTIPVRKSYQLRGNAQHRISNALTARGQVDYFSDINVQQTYHTNIYEASNRSRSYGGNITGSWGAYTLSGTGDVSETFFGETESSRYGASPRLSFNQAERALFGSPVYFAFRSEYANLLRSTSFDDQVVESGLHRIDVSPLFRIPFTRWPFLTLNTSVEWRQTYWSESLDEMTSRPLDNGISRSFTDVQTQITGPVFVKVWDTPGSAYAERMKHVIEPSFNLQRITSIDNFDQIVQLEGTDSIVGSVTQLRYGLNNRLYARRSEGGGPSVAQEILSVSASQSYYTDANATQFDRQFQTSFQNTLPSNFSPLALTVRAGPTRDLSGTLRADYDTRVLALRTIGADATINVGGWFQQTAGWSQRRFVEGLAGFDDENNRDHYLNSFTNLRTTDNKFGGVYQFNYDVQRGRHLQQRLLWYYNAQCCGLSFEYQSFNLEGLGSRVRVDQDRRLNLSFTLAGLGTFSNMLGAFGVGTGEQQ
jgi:LPS-assembly protein